MYIMLLIIYILTSFKLIVSNESPFFNNTGNYETMKLLTIENQTNNNNPPLPNKLKLIQDLLDSKRYDPRVYLYWMKADH